MRSGHKTGRLVNEQEVVSFYHFICPACAAKNNVGFNTSRQENVVFNVTKRNCRECGENIRINFDAEELRNKPRKKRPTGKAHAE